MEKKNRKTVKKIKHEKRKKLVCKEKKNEIHDEKR